MFLVTLLAVLPFAFPNYNSFTLSQSSLPVSSSPTPRMHMAFEYKTGWLRSSKARVEDPLQLDSGTVEQTSTASGRVRQKLLHQHGKAFNLHGQHQHAPNSDRDVICEVCYVPALILRAQLDFVLVIYEDQLHVYDCQREAIEKAYRNGGTMADLFPPPQLFREVKGVRPVSSGYFTKYEGYGGTFETIFPDDMRDAFAKLSSSDVEMLLDAYKARVDRIGRILDRARSSQDEPTDAFKQLMRELGEVHNHIAQDQDPAMEAPGVLIDVNVEEIQRLFAAARIGGVAELEWQKAVPKDFSMYMDVPHADYVKQKAGIRHHLDAHRALGRPVQASKRKRFQSGFDAVQLNRKHALNPGPGFPERSSTLTNDIDPVFAHKNFVDCPTDVYEVLKPGLRLASHLLFHRATSTFWHTAAFGKREVCSLNALRGEHSTKIRNDVAWAYDNACKFEKHITDIATHVRFYFNAVEPHTKVYGMCWVPCEHRRFVLPLDAMWVHYAKIHMAFDFYTTAVRLSKSKIPDPDMALRFHFLFAATIVHEFAHFLEYAHNADKDSAEPYINDNSYAEACFAFEEKTFGGRTSSISDRADCAYGLCMTATLEMSLTSSQRRTGAF